MIVLSLTSCPPKLRGFLSGWLFEIGTGIFVGNISARVREELWEQVKETVGDGRAVLVYSANNEQHMEFRMHNAEWIPTDYDGLCIMKRKAGPDKGKPVVYGEALPEFFGLSYYQKEKTAEHSSCGCRDAVPSDVSPGQRSECMADLPEDRLPLSYTVLDIETTALKPEQGEIIEIGAMKVENGCITAEFSRSVRAEGKIPYYIENYTGITQHENEKEGVECKRALIDFLDFAGGSMMVGHNVQFDIGFIDYYCRYHGLAPFAPKFIDTLILSRKRVKEVNNYRLETLLRFFEISPKQKHRALDDARLTYELLKKLNEK